MLDVLKSWRPIFYFVKIRNGSTKLRSIFLLISAIQNSGKKQKTEENIEKLRKQTFSWRTQNKKESKPKSNLNLSNKKTQYKVIFHIQI